MLFPVRTSRRNSVALSLLLACGVSACSPEARTSVAAPPSQADATATIQEIMAAKVDPAADALWASVAFIASPSGTEERRPRTAAEWRAVRGDAVSLLAAAKLLRVPGRLVKHGNSPPGQGELSAAEIQQRIDAHPDAFVRFVGRLQDAGLKALAAIDARDPQGLMDAGGVIDAACEACHLSYWYPKQNRPAN